VNEVEIFPGFFQLLSHGFANQVMGNYSNNFFNTETSGHSTSEIGRLGLTTTEMQQLSTFTNWDFQCEAANGTDDIWGIDEGNDYPRLTWEGIVQVCKTWVGSLGTDWDTANNWTPIGVPNANASIIIDPAAQNDLVLDQNRTVGDIVFNSANKKISLGDYILTVGGEVIGADANNYIQTNGTGKLKSNISANNNVRFEVGRSAYNPVEIQPTVTDTFAVVVKDTVENNTYLHLATYVDRTWEITKADTTAGGSVNFVYYWNANEIVNGPMNAPILNHYNGNNWENANGINTPGGGNPILSLTHTNYTGAFSPFAISDASTPLPVEFLGMQYECLDQQDVSLTWQTASELNAQHFEVMRSEDGFTWEKIGTVAATGTTNQLTEYQFVDEQPVRAALRYYQLKQVDFDGAFEWLPIISVNCEAGGGIRLYPNPAHHKAYLSIPSNVEELITIQLIDATGRVVMTTKHQITKGDNIVELALTALQNGIYTIVFNNNYKQQNLKLIINN
jgi:hypothetical protein